MLMNHLSWVLILLTTSQLTECREQDLASRMKRQALKYLPYSDRDMLLDYPDTPTDDDLLALSAGSGNKFGKNKEKSSVISESEEKKTLAQQVSEGKYALIQNELFLKPPKRPGILSYEANSDIPNDTVHNLGGLAKKEIWLADSHLLVLTGGTFQPYEAPDGGGGSSWRPIDFYKAPKRPVKLPTRPKVPPPFPVQFVDGGPLQILGTNFTRTLDESEKTSTTVPPTEGYIPGSGPYFPPSFNKDPSDPSSGKITFGIAAGITEAVPTPVFSLNSSNLPAHFASLPPGAVVLPPPNLTGIVEEDDSSIYYPPPYSFYYDVDNSTKVPPGPLVPGLILPPPPNFFAPLEESTQRSTKTVTTKTSISSKTSVRFRMKGSKRNETRTSTTPIAIDFKTSTESPTQKYKTKTSRVSTTHSNYYNRPIFRARNKTIQRPVNIPRPYVYRRPESLTTEKPSIVSSRLIEEIHIKTVTEKTTPMYPHLEEVKIKKIKESTTPNSLFNTYRNTGTSSKLNFEDQNVISTTKKIPVKIYITPAFESTKRPKNIYYFEEKPKYTNDVSIVTPVPELLRETPRNIYPHTPNPSTPLLRQIKITPAPSENDHFKQQIDQIRHQIRDFQTSRQDPFTNDRNKPQPLYEYSFQANNYQQQHRLNEENYNNKHQQYTVKIEPAIEVTTATPARQSSPFYESYRSTPRPASNEYYAQGDEQQNAIYKHEKNRVPYPFFDIYVYDLQGRREQGYSTPQENLAWQRRFRRPPPIQAPISLHGDTNVNYNTKGLSINPDAELIPIPQQSQDYIQRNPVRRPTSHGSRHNNYYPTYHQKDRQATPPVANPSSAFISYKLPGDEEAHFYFLTPQQVKQQHQGMAYYYKDENNPNTAEG